MVSVTGGSERNRRRGDYLLARIWELLMKSLFGSLRWHCGHIARRLRGDLELTQAELAIASGIPLSALQRLEDSGDSSLSVLDSVSAQLSTSTPAILEYVRLLNVRMAQHENQGSSS